MRTALAPAKVNLFLHVGPPDAAGMHPLASLVAFADVGDLVTLQPADTTSLEVTGPFAAALAPAGEDNLILRALKALGERRGDHSGFRVVLDKRLPIAAGLGGGSSDAGAALRLAGRRLGLAADEPALLAAAGAVGADGPMCLAATPAWAEGYGDRLTPEPRLPPLAAVLVTPNVGSPTGEVYRAYDQGPIAEADRPTPPPAWDTASVIEWLSRQRNDLERPALDRAPLISAALKAVGEAPGVRLARMSGSGSTVFGLCADRGTAEAVADGLAGDWPDWWIAACTLAG